MKIRAEYQAMGMWVADDLDGDPEAGVRGAGKSQEAAIDDLVAQLIDRAEDAAYTDGYETAQKDSAALLSDIQRERDQYREQLIREQANPAGNAAFENAITALKTADERDMMATALRNLLNRYVGLVNCGDCGNWDPEAEEEVIFARSLLKPYLEAA
jgi:hypothetical protein